MPSQHAVAVVAPLLGPDQRQVFDAMLEGRCDVAVEARLREGTVMLRGIINESDKAPRKTYRVDAAPLRPAGHAPPADREQ
jgi:hypothetical protein